MKPHTEKLFEHPMRFFTPELYVQFNSSDDDEADQADEAWEKATAEYRLHLKALRDRLPSPVRRLGELALHDAEVLAYSQDFEPSWHPPYFELGPGVVWTAAAILTVKQDDDIVSLVYVLADQVRDYGPHPGWRFSPQRTHWLYDEIDLLSERGGPFFHRILFSDGQVKEIPFVTVFSQRFPVHPFSRAPAGSAPLSGRG